MRTKITILKTTTITHNHKKKKYNKLIYTAKDINNVDNNSLIEKKHKNNTTKSNK